MDVYIVARKVGDLWEPTSTCHRDNNSAVNEAVKISQLQGEHYTVLTFNLNDAKHWLDD